jgi:hypothetical protein
MAGPNPLRPDLMTASERLAEVAAILAAGLVRLRVRQSSRVSAHREKVLWTVSPNQAVLCSPREREQDHDR